MSRTDSRGAKTGARRVVALAGNPNVGKSTVFNELTGLKQHTGNWPGKTVSLATGEYTYAGEGYRLADLPGAYSLLAHSAEEEVTRNYICFENPDAVCVVCDATCMARNLNLALQVMEITGRVAICVNLMDEARKRGVWVDTAALEDMLGVPVCAASARGHDGMEALKACIARACTLDARPRRIDYGADIEGALLPVEQALRACQTGALNPRWIALRMTEGDEALRAQMQARFGGAFASEGPVMRAAEAARAALEERGIGQSALSGRIVSALYGQAGRIYAGAVRADGCGREKIQLRLDRLLTGRRVGIPVMLALLGLIFYITIAFANLPSRWLSGAFGALEGYLWRALEAIDTPAWLSGFLLSGVYRVTAWVVSVMLPPMAIFFPLFTLLEDLGYLPRVAFNLDSLMKKCRACGKQSLTMAMGFGCNACGVIGCRIIDSPRERLIAMLTNSCVPCNGRFPTLILLLTVFFAGGGGAAGAALGALGLTALIALGVAGTLLLSALLSRSLLRGVPSSYTLELPPYRRPQLGKTIVRSVLDRTLFVLGRAVMVAAPAGALIYILSNIAPGGISLIERLRGALEPAGRLMGLDGAILAGFILGFPANEIVLPVVFAIYMGAGTLPALEGAAQTGALLALNGWSWVTALCTMLFSLFHWPCSTTCLTIARESGGARWMLAAILAPTALGFTLCVLVNAAAALLGL